MKSVSHIISLVCIFFLMSCMAFNREYEAAQHMEKMGQYVEAYELYCALLEDHPNSSLFIKAKDRSKELASSQLYELYLHSEMNNLADCYRGLEYLSEACRINPDNTVYIQAHSEHQLFTEYFRLQVKNDLMSIDDMTEKKQFQEAIALATSVLSRDIQFEYAPHDLLMNIKESASKYFLQMAKSKANNKQWDDAFKLINQALSFCETKEVSDDKNAIIKDATNEGFARADLHFKNQEYQEALDELDKIQKFGDSRFIQKRTTMISGIHDHYLAKMNTLLLQKKMAKC